MYGYPADSNCFDRRDSFYTASHPIVAAFGVFQQL